MALIGSGCPRLPRMSATPAHAAFNAPVPRGGEHETEAAKPAERSEADDLEQLASAQLALVMAQ